MADSIEEKLLLARTVMLTHQALRFFGYLALELPFKRDDNLPAPTATDMRYIYYNPEMLDKYPIEEIVSIVCHEIFHCVFMHPTRIANRNPLGWNIASDYVVNEHIDKCGLKLPSSCIFDKALWDKSADEIYNLLISQAETQKHKISGEGGTEQGEISIKDYTVNTKGEGKKKISDIKITCVLKPASGSEHDKKRLETEWSVKIEEAARQAGNVPGALSTLLGELTKSRIDWRTALRTFVDPAKNEYSYKKPSRRMTWGNLIIPGVSGEQLERMIFAFDTSGSVPDKDLQAGLSEVADILDVWPHIEGIVYQVDSIVQSIITIEQMEKAIQARQARFYGRGGTDFNPVFEDVKQKGINPIGMVFFTDGYPNHSWPNEPSYPVLWIMSTNVVAPWGQTVFMNEKPV